MSEMDFYLFYIQYNTLFITSIRSTRFVTILRTYQVNYRKHLICTYYLFFRLFVRQFRSWARRNRFLSFFFFDRQYCRNIPSIGTPATEVGRERTWARVAFSQTLQSSFVYDFADLISSHEPISTFYKSLQQQSVQCLAQPN